MQAKPLFMAAALATLSATTAFAQSAPSQSAPTQDNPQGMSAPDASQPAEPNNAAPSTTASPSAAVPATTADLKPASAVYDATGGKVGTIESVTSTGAVVFTGVARAQIPVASFAKNSQGLVIGMTKSQLEAAVAKATPAKS